MTRKVRFLKDEVDIDLDVVVTEYNKEERVDTVNDGIMFFRYNKVRDIEQAYIIPYSEEGIYFEFID